MEGRILFAPVRPLTGVSVEAADACRGRYPDVPVDDGNGVANVIQEAAGEVGEVLKLPAGQVTDSAKGGNPQVARFFVHRYAHHRTLHKTVFGGVNSLHFAVLDQH